MNVGEKSSCTLAPPKKQKFPLTNAEVGKDLAILAETFSFGEKHDREAMHQLAKKTTLWEGHKKSQWKKGTVLPLFVSLRPKWGQKKIGCTMNERWFPHRGEK